MRRIRNELTCIHCWHRFSPDQTLWISEHRELVGDPLLGPDKQLRFLPNRFDLHGNALDARGEVCRNIACPDCHLALPGALLEREPIFVSILGAPYCGKSFFLAAMTTKLRQDLPARFLLGFSDADLIANETLLKYEENMFVNQTPDKSFILKDLVAKTQLNMVSVYYQIKKGSETFNLPRAFSFLLDPLGQHPGVGEVRRRVAVFYDNAGEHFLAGGDSLSTPGTRHLAESLFWLFLFDPTQDPRWRSALKGNGAPAHAPADQHEGRQETVLREASIRVRKLLNMGDDQRSDRPLIVVLNKSDAWFDQMAKESFPACQAQTNQGVWALNIAEIERQSASMRQLVQDHVPELCFTAESFAEKVFYIPVSALGKTPDCDDQGVPHMRPQDIQPRNVTTPFLLGMALSSPGLIRCGRARTDAAANGSLASHAKESTSAQT